MFPTRADRGRIFLDHSKKILKPLTLLLQGADSNAKCKICPPLPLCFSFSKNGATLSEVSASNAFIQVSTDNMFMEKKISSTANSDLPSPRASLSSIGQTGHALFGLNSDEQLDQLEDLSAKFGATDDELQMLESFLKNSDGVDLNCLQDELSFEEELECAKNIDEVTQMISSMDEENSRSDVGAHIKGRKCKYRGVSQTAGKKWGAKYGEFVVC